MTGQDLINGTLRLIGVLAASEQPSATESNNALQSLNDMLDSWSNERLLIFSVLREVFALTVGQQIYTFGVGGGFNSARPMRIENALIQLPNTSPVLEMPMRILNKDQYAGLLVKSVQSTFPLYIYNDDAFPQANINVWPIPSAACSLALYNSKPLTQIASPTTTLSLPPGFQRAMKYNLAVDLAPEFGRQMSPDALEIAVSSKAELKRQNSKPYYLRSDDAVRSRSAVWNWYTGEPT